MNNPTTQSVAMPNHSANPMDALLAEIREANLSYLLLAQGMLRLDRAEACLRLGIDNDTAELILTLSTAQILRIANQGMLLSKFRFEDSMVWNLLASPKRDETISAMHASILMASKTAESV